MTHHAACITARTPLPRSRGRAEIVRQDGRLARLYQQGCARLLMPKGGAPEAVFVNTAGGLTGGDRVTLMARLGAGEALTLTTQAAERIYRAAEDQAQVRADLTLGPGARLDWLPQETILFDGAALTRRLEARLAPGARLLAVESLIFGRAAHGEAIRRLQLRDHWRIWQDDRLIHAESLRLDGLPDGPATLRGMRAMATLVLAAPDADSGSEAARGVLAGCGIRAGITALPGLLIGRITAASGAALRAALIPLIRHLRGGDLPRVWQF